jgi:DNA repair protein RecN (Recombination protein N)
MLTHLSIRDVVVVDKLDIDFAPGLCVLTGETGAGKSIVLDALGLALGGRSDTGLIRSGADKLSVTASFSVASDHPACAVLVDQDINLDDMLVLRRVVGADGRSRAFINDQPVSVGLLKSVGDMLVEVHGQFETHGLLDPATHLAVLDAYRIAKTGDPPDRTCAGAWTAWHAAAEELTAAQNNLASALSEEDTLRHQVSELETLAPKEGEESALSQTRSRLRYGEQIIQALANARNVVSDNVDVESALRTALTHLSKVSPLAEGRLDSLCQSLERAAIETGEAFRELEQVGTHFEADPAGLERAEERLFALKAVARKHNCAPDDLPTVMDLLSMRLAALDNGSEAVKRLAASEKSARLAFEKAAGALSKARQDAARTLDKLVVKELPPLKLDKAAFRTVISTKPETAWNNTGLDKAVFEVTTNPGLPPGPLNKIASGGELARFMLALKVVLAGTQDRAALIFDEVDAGISGATASAVGERLAKLAKTVQVLVVTHAPQVAAQGDHHWRVAKASRAGGTTATVDLLAAAQSREEIARMLAGESITDEARAAADSLVDAAS